MKEIILIRHATAEAQDVENDLSRKLVSKGLKESLNVGLFLLPVIVNRPVRVGFFQYFCLNASVTIFSRGLHDSINSCF